MCRNITELRGLAPPATAEEIDAAALQFVRKVSGLTKPPADPDASRAYHAAVHDIAAATTTLLAAMPARRQPPATVPPLRRPEVRKRIAEREARAAMTRR